MASNDKAFVKSLLYRRRDTVSAILKDVDTMHELDKTYEKKASKWNWIALISIVGGFVCVILAVVAADALAGLLMPLWGLGGLGLFGCIPCFFLWIRFSKLDTEDRRYELLEEILQLLQTAMAPDSPTQVRLDLSASELKKKLSGEGKEGSWEVKHYTDPWLQLQGRFLDGTTFLVDVTDRFQKKSRWVQSRSGKRKHKTKAKTATVFQVRLKPKAKRYQHLSELGRNAAGALQLPPGVESKKFEVEDGSLLVKAQEKDAWDTAAGKQTVAMMFLSLYQILNLSRTMTKRVG